MHYVPVAHGIPLTLCAEFACSAGPGFSFTSNKIVKRHNPGPDKAAAADIKNLSKYTLFLL
jgi:hypothetical protein